MFELRDEDVACFQRDGFVIVENWLDPDTVDKLRARFDPLFKGVFDAGLQPDEWNWRFSNGDPTLTRQICNGWKADRTVASVILQAEVGKAAARLRGWPGARINQDNVIWKPPGSKALGFHQDDSYQDWIVPNEMLTCWMALDDTCIEQGTIEYVRGSHLWPLSPPITQFHAPDDPFADMRAAADHAGIAEPELVPIEVAAGAAVFHHGKTWHGSRANTGDAPRRSVIAHCMSSDAMFHDTNIGPIYGRYKRHGTQEMDESFFPILWREDGYRTAWI